jgi:hypothetical protein
MLIFLLHLSDRQLVTWGNRRRVRLIHIGRKMFQYSRLPFFRSSWCSGFIGQLGGTLSVTHGAISSLRRGSCSRSEKFFASAHKPRFGFHQMFSLAGFWGASPSQHARVPSIGTYFHNHIESFRTTPSWSAPFVATMI